jgi:HEAT repeat protein
MIVWGTEKLLCKMNWGYCEYYDLRADPREQRNLAESAPDRAARLRGRLDDWLDDHLRFEPQMARGQANPDGSAVPKAIERGRLGDLSAVGELSAMLTGEAPLAVRREAARLLVTLPPRQETRAQILAALSVEDAEIRDWATVAAARLGDGASLNKIRELVTRSEAGAEPRTELRVEAAMALARARDTSGVPVLTAQLDDCAERVLFCQLIILELGKLRDRRAVPALLAHLPEVQNRREMVVALGDIGDPRAAGALMERLENDEYVPVRVESARALAKLGGAGVQAALERSMRQEREQTVRDAARAALITLTAVASPPPAKRGRPRSPRRAAAQ